MSSVIDLTVPTLPDCWDTCGNCSDGEVKVVEWFVQPGDSIKAFDPIMVIETEKTTLEIPTQMSGEVVELCVAPGDVVREDSLLLRIKR